MQITDHWMDFLEKRMLVIQAALLEGMSISEIGNLVGVDPTQLRLLCHEAKKRNDQAHQESLTPEGGDG